MPFKINEQSGIEGAANFNGGGINRNKIHNGEFRIHQRGVYQNPLSEGDYVRDRWQYFQLDIDQLEVRNTNTGNTFRGLQSLKLTCSTPEAAVAPGELSEVRQEFEGNELADLVDKTFYVRFMARAETIGGGTLSVALRDTDPTTISFVQEFNITTTTTLYHFVVPGGIPNANQSDFNINSTDRGMVLTFTFMAGSNTQTSTLGQWQTGNFTASTNQTNFWAATNNAVYLSEIQLCVGDSPVPFVSRPYAEELAICQRYYDSIGSSTQWVGTGYALNTTTALIFIPYYHKRINNPQTSVTDAAHFSVDHSGGFAAVSAFNPFGFVGFTGMRANVTTSGLITGQGCALRASDEAGRIIIDAEL